MNKERFAKLIKELREEKGYSQAELADKIPISREAVSKWENKKTFPEPDSIERLSDIFDISVIELLYGERKKEKTIAKMTIEAFKGMKKYKRYFILSSAILVISLFLFLSGLITYFFFATYNSVQIYTLDVYSPLITIRNGLVVYTNEQVHFYLGEISSDENIESIILWYLEPNNNEYKTVLRTDSFNVSLVDYATRNKYFEVKDMDEIINNLHLTLKINNEDYQISLDFEKRFANDFSLSRKEYYIDVRDLDVIDKISPVDSVIKKFTYEDNKYLLKLNDYEIFSYVKGSNEIYLIYDDEIILKKWQYNIKKNIYYYEEMSGETVTSSFVIIDNHNVQCRIGYCDNALDSVQIFKEKYEKLLEKES